LVGLAVVGDLLGLGFLALASARSLRSANTIANSRTRTATRIFLSAAETAAAAVAAACSVVLSLALLLAALLGLLAVGLQVVGHVASDACAPQASQNLQRVASQVTGGPQLSTAQGPGKCQALATPWNGSYVSQPYLYGEQRLLCYYQTCSATLAQNTEELAAQSTVVHPPRRGERACAPTLPSSAVLLYLVTSTQSVLWPCCQCATWHSLEQ
jgi:hypothetical protein